MCDKLSPNKICMPLSVFLDCIDGRRCHLVLQVPLLVFNHMVRTHKSGGKEEIIISIINLVLPPFPKSCDRVNQKKGTAKIMQQLWRKLVSILAI